MLNGRNLLSLAMFLVLAFPAASTRASILSTYAFLKVSDYPPAVTASSTPSVQPPLTRPVTLAAPRMVVAEGACT